MIQEIINFINETEKSNPALFQQNKEPSEGLHIFVELDGEGKWKNKQVAQGIDYDFYDGKSELSPFLIECMKYEDYGKRVGTSMNKVLDKKKQIFSCSPFVVNFKKQSFVNDKLDGIGASKITNLFPFYFENAQQVCLDKEDETTIQQSKAFAQACIEVLNQIDSFTIPQTAKDGAISYTPAFEIMKDAFYVNLYFKNISLDKYKQAHENYLKQKLFNTNEYNNETEISGNTYGLSNFLNGLNSKKPFLEHKTALMYKGISGRITAKEAVALNNFELLLSNKVLPNPIPLFIDKSEFATGREIISIFNDSERKLSYSQVLKKVCEENNKNLSNYYLLNIIKGEVKDFDFVSLFRYKMERQGNACKIINLFDAKLGKELDSTITIRTIFGFESKVVRNIFNNSLVKVDEKKDSLSVNYFGDIDPTYVSGGDLVYQMIMKYRQAFYNYIYKSQENAITCLMFDDIMYNVILADLRKDEAKDGKFHTKEMEIKRKLNIWFSLYDYFNLTNKTQNTINMASKIEELLNKVRSVANDDNAHLSDDPAEFAFAAGQMIYYLISKSVASNKTYAMLEPFLQKHTTEQISTAIAEMINTYKHEIDMNHGRFARLAKDVLSNDAKIDMKKYQRYLLAGCFASSLIYEKKTEVENNEQ